MRPESVGKLCNAALPRLRGRSALVLPEYGRAGLIPSVVHLGLGAFHRAHQAMVFDRLLTAGDARWAVHGVAMRNPQLADSLAAQDGLYAVQIASSAGLTWQVPGALVRTSVAARERDQVLAAIAAPTTRWITLTVTEKGYGAELAELLVDGLARRFAAGAGITGITIVSCDNLSDNGRKLQALCVAAADERSAALAAWIASACAFPCSMVDRIVPAATPARLAAARAELGLEDACALGTEAFTEWVIERRFVDQSDGARLSSAGVTVVDDVRPFEEAKLRMLNGSHSAMAAIGVVAGLPVIADCINQPCVRELIYGLMTHEVAPHLARPDWESYRDALLARFSNPELKHSVHQIATDSSLKISQRWPLSVLGQLQAGKSFERMAFAAAVWMRYCRGVDEAGREYVIADPNAALMQALANQHAASAPATVKALGGLRQIWGEVLPAQPHWLARVTHWITEINAHGVLATTARVNQLTAG